MCLELPSWDHAETQTDKDAGVSAGNHGSKIVNDNLLFAILWTIGNTEKVTELNLIGFV